VAYEPCVSGKRFIDVTSFGNLSGLSSYHACCGAVLQVSLQLSASCALWRCLEAFGICWVYAPRSNLTNSPDQPFFVGEFMWITAFLAFTLVSYLFSSGKQAPAYGRYWSPMPIWMYPGLVIYRIWTIERKASAVRTTKRKMPILRVLVDATILYSAALCPFIIIFYTYSSAVFYVMGDMVIMFINCLLLKILSLYQTSSFRLFRLFSIWCLFASRLVNMPRIERPARENEWPRCNFVYHIWRVDPRRMMCLPGQQLRNSDIYNCYIMDPLCYNPPSYSCKRQWFYPMTMIKSPKRNDHVNWILNVIFLYTLLMDSWRKSPGRAMRVDVPQQPYGAELGEHAVKRKQ